MNRIGVLIELEGGDEETAVDVAMHVAAMNPPYATPDQVPADVLEKEKRVLTEQALESGKPADIVEKVSQSAALRRHTLAYKISNSHGYSVCLDGRR